MNAPVRCRGRRDCPRMAAPDRHGFCRACYYAIYNSVFGARQGKPRPARPRGGGGGTRATRGVLRFSLQAEEYLELYAWAMRVGPDAKRHLHALIMARVRGEAEPPPPFLGPPGPLDKPAEEERRPWVDAVGEMPPVRWACWVPKAGTPEAAWLARLEDLVSPPAAPESGGSAPGECGQPAGPGGSP